MSTLPEWAIRKLVFPLWSLRDHPGYRGDLRDFLRTQFLSRAQIEALQLERLNKLLKHAYAQCPFYRRRLAEAGINGDRLPSLDAFKALPLLGKREIQDNGAEMLATDFSESDRVRSEERRVGKEGRGVWWREE